MECIFIFVFAITFRGLSNYFGPKAVDYSLSVKTAAISPSIVSVVGWHLALGKPHDLESTQCRVCWMGLKHEDTPLFLARMPETEEFGS